MPPGDLPVCNILEYILKRRRWLARLCFEFSSVNQCLNLLQIYGYFFHTSNLIWELLCRIIFYFGAKVRIFFQYIGSFSHSFRLVNMCYFYVYPDSRCLSRYFTSLVYGSWCSFNFADKQIVLFVVNLMCMNFDFFASME